MGLGSKKTAIRVVLISFSIIIFLVFGFVIYIYLKLDNMYLDESKEMDLEQSIEDTETPIPDESYTPLPTIDRNSLQTPFVSIAPKTNEDLGIINIAVFGMDNRNRYTIVSGRSDVNMILTIDTKNQEVRLTSFIRDTLVYIEELEDYNRLNAAIVYAKGPTGAVECIENEFGIDIDYYMVTNFVGMARIINAVGGVNVYISSGIAADCADAIREMNPLMGYSTNSNLIYKTGNVNLNGIQAVAYMRQRKREGGFARDDKQKEVLLAVRDKLQTLSLEEINDLLNVVTDNVKTDMSPFQLVEITKYLFDYRGSDYTTIRMPLNDTYYVGWYKKMSVVHYEKDKNLYPLYDFIYKGIYPYEESDEPS
ncbi:MAG: LCP family protein [Eubacteriales bacterium]